MKLKLNKFLASPLKKAVNFLETEQLDYRLKEITPPYKNKDNLKKFGTKRVLKIEKDVDNDLYLITWSFQYNS
ncbi:MAG: hypothetical protein A8274_589 [Halanaerobium sp. 4-GBenrich]|jgi:hypothetical protein|nr:MAG: hypothetical protein A8274_589 [Halanaerobium sp. 4-GBenrich]